MIRAACFLGRFQKDQHWSIMMFWGRPFYQNPDLLESVTDCFCCQTDMWHCYTIIWLLSVDVMRALKDKVHITCSFWGDLEETLIHSLWCLMTRFLLHMLSDIGMRLDSRVKPRKVFRDFKYKSVGRKVKKMHTHL